MKNDIIYPVTGQSVRRPIRSRYPIPSGLLQDMFDEFEADLNTIIESVSPAKEKFNGSGGDTTICTIKHAAHNDEVFVYCNGDPVSPQLITVNGTQVTVDLPTDTTDTLTCVYMRADVGVNTKMLMVKINNALTRVNTNLSRRSISMGQLEQGRSNSEYTNNWRQL